jgi:acetoin utilization deacetylase AcuC-like enzyme
MKIFYCDGFPLPLPQGHRFPIQKYVLLKQAVMAASLGASEDMVVPEPATDEQILRAHDVDYLKRVVEGDLTPKEVRRIGLPWSPELVARTRCSVGGTIAACRAALRDGVAVSLAGGTHHAFRDHGQGYCVFNDSVIAARAMQAEGLVRRGVIVDCDVHQGNGTAAILADDPTIFTFSIHGARNFPFHKELSDLDIELEDGTEDADYLEALRAGLARALELADADLAIYLAGADPYAGDQLGRLSLSKEGLGERDCLVFELCRGVDLPVATVMSGGYGRQIEDTVDIHLQTVRIAAGMARGLDIKKETNVPRFIAGDT